ncbi:malonyl-ACP O-methyltransferase BioC [Wohlfahrtiimonas larvae]|uniref:Malonyl-[acyl-carrier protein] O-methyltransferase n=1 Tax=Wohlfahrtiimonas larvae TaxID=1157986 RepID=A0ABP9MUC1_9GAMM|nr:malonyl-ACP O-methyltransferase BioC [Wohlfahrtiimonas larvae]
MRLVDKNSIAVAFSKAVQTYDQQASLQREIADSLIQQVLQNVPMGKILDAGCGTGYVAQKLKKNDQYYITALDLSEMMLYKAESNHSAHNYVQGDIEALPFKDGSFDCVVSNLAMQWCHSLEMAMIEQLRVLKLGGQLYLSTLIQPSLWELKKAWQTVDNEQHVMDFISGEILENHLAQLELNPKVDHIVCHCYAKELLFNDIFSLLKSLQNIGATALPQRKKGLMGKDQLQKLADAYAIYQDESGLPLTYYVAELRVTKL